jgi:hypothetical protein
VTAAATTEPSAVVFLTAPTAATAAAEIAVAAVAGGKSSRKQRRLLGETSSPATNSPAAAAAGGGGGGGKLTASSSPEGASGVPASAEPTAAAGGNWKLRLYPNMPSDWSPERQEMYLQGHILSCYNAHTAMNYIRSNWGTWGSHPVPSDPFKFAEDRQQRERGSITGVTSHWGDFKWHKKLLASFRSACRKVKHRPGRVPSRMSRSFARMLREPGVRTYINEDGEYMWEITDAGDAATDAVFGGSGSSFNRSDGKAGAAAGGGRLSSFVLDQVVELYWSI